MKKVLLVIARYDGPLQETFNKYISPRNKHYAEKHGYTYIEITNNTELELIRNAPTWWKFSVVRDLINNGQLEDGDILLHLDADIYIVDDSCDLQTTKSFTYSIDSGNTHCMGWYSLKINDWSKALINNILSEERYQKFNNKQTLHFGGMSSFWEIFREQASWYSLAGIQRHSDIPFWNLPNFGFHSDNSYDTVYSLDELNEHVHIFGTEYNVTEWPGESNCDFNINKLPSRDKVLIRHFVSGQWKNSSLIENWMFKNTTNKKKIYIEAGAVDGSFQSRSDYLKDNLDYRGILIEPDPRCQSQLVQNRLNDRTTIVHAALVPLSYTEKTIDINLHNHSAMNSMSNCQEERKGDYWAHGFEQTVHVPARTLQSILDENNVTVIENLFLDTEGFEEEVIRGIDHTRTKINNAEIEVHGTIWPEHLRKNINTFIPLMKEWFDLNLVDIIHEGCPKLVFSHEQPQHDSEYYVKLKY